MKFWKVVFVTLFSLLLVTSCSISTKSRRQSDLKDARSDGFVAGCTFAANGVAEQLGVSINPESLNKICKENSAK